MGDVDTEKGQTGSETVIMHHQAATQAGDTCPAPRRRPAAGQAPLTNRTFLTTSRSLGYHSKSIAREEEAEAEEGTGQGKGQQTGIRERKTRAQTSQCREVTRWKQGMKISVLRLQHQEVCPQNNSDRILTEKSAHNLSMF